MEADYRGFDQSDLKKLIKKHGEDFVKEVFSLERGELEVKLSDLAKHFYHLEEFPKTKPEIKEAKENLKELMAPFTAQKSANKAKSKLVNLILERKFGEGKEE